MTRHQMRESIFLLTFERIFNDEPVETIVETAKECETVPVDARVIAWFEDICKKQEMIDEEIKKIFKKLDDHTNFKGVACGIACCDV